MKKILLTLLFLSVTAPVFVLAQSAGVGVTPPVTQSSGKVEAVASLPNPLGDKVKSIPDLFYLIVNALISVSYVVIAFFLIWSGFKFVSAQGEPDKITDAKNTFKYTIIGALIIIGAQTIIAIVKSIISGLGITG